MIQLRNPNQSQTCFQKKIHFGDFCYRRKWIYVKIMCFSAIRLETIIPLMKLKISYLISVVLQNSDHGLQCHLLYNLNWKVWTNIINFTHRRKFALCWKNYPFVFACLTFSFVCPFFFGRKFQIGFLVFSCNCIQRSGFPRFFFLDT